MMQYVEKITVCPSTVALQAGKWYYGAQATVCPENADCPQINWISNDPSVATVDNICGHIHALNPGTARIYACTADDSGISDYITVNVTSNVSVPSVTLNQTSLSLEKGDYYTLTATVCPEKATNQAICWRSTNAKVAEVCNGVVTAKTKGTACIYAETTDDSGEYARCRVTVTENNLGTSVSI